MINKRLIPTLLALSLMVSQSFAGEILDSGRGKVADKIADLDIKFDTDLLDLDVAEALNASIKYTYEVQPSYIDNYYSRIDKIGINTKISPLDLLPDGSPINFNLNTGSEIVYVRQLKSQKEALKQLPKVFLLNKLPSTAEKAAANLKVGDFVSLNAELNLVFSAAVAASQGWIVAKASTYYSLKGNFNIRLYRLKNNKLRMQLIALRKKSKGAKGAINIDNGFSIFGIDVVDKQIKKLINLNIAEIGKNKSDNDLFMVDYVIDLNSQKVRDAYNSIVSSSLDISKLNKAKILNPTRDQEQLKKLLENNINSLEEIRAAERHVHKDKKSVTRIFKGKNSSKSESFQIKIGLNTFRFTDSELFRENNLSVEEKDGSKSYYYFPTVEITDIEEWLFGQFEENEYLNINALFEQTKDHKNKKFVSFGAYYTRTDKLLNGNDRTVFSNEQENLKKELMRLVPENIYESIEWGEWNNEKTRKNARITNEIYFNRNLLDIISEVGLSQLDFERQLTDYILSLVEKGSDPKTDTQMRLNRKYCKSEYLKKAIIRKEQKDRLNNDRFLRQNRLDTEAEYIGFYAGDICKIAHELAFVFDKAAPSEERVQRFLALKDMDTFKDFGLGFTLSLVPLENQSESFRVKVKWSAKGTKSMSFDSMDLFKSNSDKADGIERELYQSILSMQSILNNRSFDLRLTEEIISDDKDN